MKVALLNLIVTLAVALVLATGCGKTYQQGISCNIQINNGPVQACVCHPEAPIPTYEECQ